MNNFQRFIKKNAPTILTVLACAGVAGTAVMVAKKAPTASKKIEESRDEEGKITKETAIIFAKEYGPSIALGASTMACIIGANVLNQKNQAIIISAYAACNEMFKNYRNEVIERHGKEEDEEICTAIRRGYGEYVSGPDFKALYKIPFIKDAYIEAYEREILFGEMVFTESFMLSGTSSVADLALCLGLAEYDIPIYAYEEGWSLFDDLYWPHITHELIGKDAESDLPIYEILIDADVPRRGFMDDFT